MCSDIIAVPMYNNDYFNLQKCEWVFLIYFLQYIAYIICDKKKILSRNSNKILATFKRPQSFLITALMVSWSLVTAILSVYFTCHTVEQDYF